MRHPTYEVEQGQPPPAHTRPTFEELLDGLEMEAQGLEGQYRDFFDSIDDD